MSAVPCWESPIDKAIWQLKQVCEHLPWKSRPSYGGSFSGDWYTSHSTQTSKDCHARWEPGKPRSRKNRYPTVKKQASKPRKEPSIAV